MEGCSFSVRKLLRCLYYLCRSRLIIDKICQKNEIENIWIEWYAQNVWHWKMHKIQEGVLLLRRWLYIYIYMYSTIAKEQRDRILTHNWIKFHQRNLYGPYYGPGYMARVLANQANSISSLTDKLNMLSKVVADLRHTSFQLTMRFTESFHMGTIHHARCCYVRFVKM